MREYHAYFDSPADDFLAPIPLSRYFVGGIAKGSKICGNIFKTGRNFEFEFQNLGEFPFSFNARFRSNFQYPYLGS